MPAFTGERPEADPAWIAAIRRELVSWYDRGHRELPWRADRDPYRILVSEMMLVQTTVAAVVPFFGRFLARFPDVAALAAADEEAVLKAWEGLGYYRRARQLHQAARAIVELHGGVVPDDPEALRALPGVGRYMAGAVLSLAFDRPAPIVEANTRRVLARLAAWNGELSATDSQARLWELAEALVPPERAGAFNQAMMELGATVCTPREPSCLICPIASACLARAGGLQDALPKVAARPAPTAVEEACAVVERGARWLMVRRAPGNLWAGFWEFPTLHRGGADPAGRSFGEPTGFDEGIERLTGVRIRGGQELATVRFTVTRYRVTLTAIGAEGLDEATRPGPGLVEAAWFLPSSLDGLTLGSATRKLRGHLPTP
ncbi:MAG: A/G-specific adenine glycosylase [Isosphaeraceae bacterium]